MLMSRKRTMWTLGVLVANLMITAALGLQTLGTSARAQLSGIAGLTAAQLTRVQRMQGEFIYQSRAASRAAAWKAIEVGTTGLGPAQRRRTRAQLEQLLAPPPHIEFALETASGGTPSLTVHEGRSVTSAPLTGEARALLPKGARADAQPLQLSHQLQGTSLLRVVEGNGFRQERRFSLSADAVTLTLEIRVAGPTLAGPLATTAVYRRL
jgi:hypothetical protein